ncbi:hypothetical protein [Paenibacillus odorifer]|uniref:hypothetical protein n=1 Tax=Paenibacillus odorifer TaxID=189426 RepID=UPI00096C5616|nr:hypothetical protein [Paenibacillus odorifer]OMD66775.1 hypothetical protein BSK50_30635 [Paenibacillus odorifer]
MILDKEFIEDIKNVSMKAGGYLTTSLYDKNRGSLPAWETIKKKFNNIEFSELLIKCGVFSKEEFLKKTNRIKAISNFRIINLENGYVSKVLYDSFKFSPSSEYISKHYGWTEIAKEAEVKLANSQYLSIDDMISELKVNIKKLKYIPTSSEYDSLGIKPSQKSFTAKGLQWSQAMRKAGYKPYGKSVTIKDKVCSNDSCYRQFTPTDDKEILCEPCYKELRAKLVKELDGMSSQKLKEVSTRLIFAGNSQTTVLDIFKSI